VVLLWLSVFVAYFIIDYMLWVVRVYNNALVEEEEFKSRILDCLRGDACELLI
jgi:TM2 domain-containing membrane protein YozV